ncbi:MAG: hypothetical protein OXP73_01760 [Chloroflexota bacterium]|nr:hypothetical protein [Chloroflexota bacterium]
MRNITVSVDDATYRRARIRAAELDTSVSALVREYLKGLSAGVLTERAGGNRRASHEDYLKRLDDLFADWDARGVGLRMSDNLSRDELYDRDAARAAAARERERLGSD